LKTHPYVITGYKQTLVLPYNKSDKLRFKLKLKAQK
jgi:hypothetical protein